MSVGQLDTLVRHVRRLADLTSIDGLSDSQLLARFQSAHEEPAFAALMRRHGRQVWSVCRRVLGNEHDAEDAFQATFLVLARKAGSIRSTEAVGSWLHGAAYRIAMRAKRDAAIRRKHEQRTRAAGADPLVSANGSPARTLALREGMALLDQEVEQLPERQRAVFVACCLEGKTMAEAARDLGWKEGTVSGTLARAKERLRSRLARRGVTLSAALAALALGETAAAALPENLALSTLRAALRYAAGGPAPAALAALLRGATRTMLFTKVKIATIVLFVFVGAACGFALAKPEAAESTKPQAPQADAKAQAAKDKDSHILRGRVLDPDGKPIAGANLYWPHLLKQPPQSLTDLTLAKKASTDANGRFELTLGPSELKDAPRPYLIAAAEGFGFDWMELNKEEKSAQFTFRLAKDMPVEGRVLDTQGKPIANAKVVVTGIQAQGKEQLDTYLTILKNNWHELWRARTRLLFANLNPVLNVKATDKDGRFTLRGLGAERVATMEIEGSGMAKASIYVVTRSGFDAKALNEAAVANMGGPPRLNMIPTLYGPRFDYIAAPTRTIEGVIRDVDTGSPIAGAQVRTSTGYNSQVTTISDAQGNYRLTGLPKTDEYLVGVLPPNPKQSNLLSRTIGVPGPEGLGPIKQDIELAHGVVVTGRIIDQSTGKGIQGGVRFVPLPDNKFFGKPGYDGYRRDRTMMSSDPDGSYRVVVIPGPGVLMAQVFGREEKFQGQAVNPFRAARFSPEDSKRVKEIANGGDRLFNSAGNSIEFLGLEGAVKVVDFAEGTTNATADLFPERGKTLPVRIEDPEGKPLAGAIVSGMTELWPITFTAKQAECTIYALDGIHQRHVVFYHRERKLGGHVIVRGDEKDPVTVRLQPLGTVTGRLLDPDGQPLAGVEVSLNMPLSAESDLFRYLNAQREPVKTDKDGRFRLEGVLPKLIFQLSLRQGRTYYQGEPKIGFKQVGPGQTLDLGEVRVKGTKF
jgi:RNA polymerase sigma factor (sigma-70 family)